jgi:hypothetical protein
MNNRNDIKDFILLLENEFPVNSWTMNGIHLWPYLRIRLFFFLIKQIEATPITPKAPDQKSHSNKKASFRLLIKSSVFKIKTIAKYLKWLLALPERKFFFAGFDAHRINYQGYRYNKFFDTLIEEYQIRNQSVFFEFGSPKTTNHYHKDILYGHFEAIKGYSLLKRLLPAEKPNEFLWEDYGHFYNNILSNPLTKSFAAEISQEKVEAFGNDLQIRIRFFKKALKRIKPEKVLLLCYYSGADIMALAIAANQLQIETIEMQHGPQVDIHMCYGSWLNIPESGFDLLPRNFWCWDAYSESVLQKWVSLNDLYHVRVVGNPWVDYWKEKKTGYEHQDYILYSLQPEPVTIAMLFPKNIIHFIKMQKYKWFLRLHPRQMHDKQNIMSFLMENGILDFVEIEYATNDPLPQLLLNARLHITHFSGSAIEAELFNVYTVLLNDIGVLSFPDLISQGKAAYINPESDDFEGSLLDVLKKPRPEAKNSIFAAEKPDTLF